MKQEILAKVERLIKQSQFEEDVGITRSDTFDCKLSVYNLLLHLTDKTSMVNVKLIIQEIDGI